MKRGRKTDERTSFQNSAGRFLCRARGPRPVSPERLRPTKDRGYGGRAENHPVRHETGKLQGTGRDRRTGKAHALQVEPATTTIKRAGKVVVLKELRLGDKVSAEFERMQDKDVARVIEAQKGSH